MLVGLIGTSIKERRKALKITQPHLAGLAGISVNSLYKIESAQANPTVELIDKLFEVLGMEMVIQVKQTLPT